MSLAHTIDELLRRNATFAAFRIPGKPVLAYVQHHPELHPPASDGTDGQQPAFILAPFRTDRAPVGSIRPDLVLDLEGAHPSLEGIEPRFAPERQPLLGLDRNGYHAAVEQATDAIQQGKLDKVVLARTIAVDLESTTPGQLFAEAARQMPSAFVALVRTDRTGTWLGATPERLLTVRNGRVEVDALAGTMAADVAPRRAAEWGEKERVEQDLVTRMVTTTLAEEGVQDLRTEGPHPRVAGPVAHLHTRVTGTTKDLDPLRLAAALHPTPAVGGTPRQAAFDLIDRSEPRDRGLYAGYWGPMTAEGADLFVNIRCMELHGGRALLHVGAGITADSIPDHECDEVEHKAGTWTRSIDTLRGRG